MRKTRKAPTRSMVVRGDHRTPKAGPRRSMVVRGNTGPLTIPQLRRAFESVDRFVAKAPSVPEFQKFWKKTFGKAVSAEVARDYLQFASKKQSGGAPLNYEMGEPAGPAPNVPSYVSSGFGFANVPGFINQCGTVDMKNPIPADMGSNKVGGARSTRRARKQRGGAADLTAAFAEFVTRPVGMSSPVTSAQAAQTLANGAESLPSPRPEVPSFAFGRPPTVFTGNPPSSSFRY